MTAYVIRRALLLLPLLLAVSFIVFVLIRSVPGDPARVIAGDKAPQEEVEKIRKQYGWDKPILVQYVHYLGRLVQGDLGISYRRPGETVTSEIARRLPPTIELTFVAMFLAIIGGVLIGVISAVYKGTWIDYLSMTFALLGVSVPVFWLGLLLLIAFGGIFAVGGNLNLQFSFDPITGFMLIDTLLIGRFDMFFDALKHLVLPGIALASIPAAMTARITRSSMLDVINSDYIRTARAKGLAPRKVILRHALRNALIPIITLIGLEFGYLLGGAVLTETVFDWPGMGTYILRAVQDREYDSLLGGILMLATTFVVVNLIVDILYAYLDPRVRYGPKEA
ncbi:MAG: ABC transporter permease [Planctomycetota bacterium]